MFLRWTLISNYFRLIPSLQFPNVKWWNYLLIIQKLKFLHRTNGIGNRRINNNIALLNYLHNMIFDINGGRRNLYSYSHYKVASPFVFLSESISLNVFPMLLRIKRLCLRTLLHRKMCSTLLYEWIYHKKLRFLFQDRNSREMKADLYPSHSFLLD